MEFVDTFAVDRPDDEPAARAATTEAVWSALADDTFMAALTWQNPSVVDTLAHRLAALARSGERPPLSRRNERERVIARYAQRYATKNESIGFFGPVAWGTFTDAAAPLSWRGTLGLRDSTVSFEVWAIVELARSWGERPEVRPHLPVRLHPASTVDYGRLLRPRRPPRNLDGAAAALLAALAPKQTLSMLVARRRRDERSRPRPRSPRPPRSCARPACSRSGS
ncbi:lantibiotic dehydratase [Kutzneria kofuensis]|uniref:lantibiotic dehydratase n=1 Tax=Kutzneria kofuensis TaxID=103725 RepID=UPI0031EFF0E2